MCEDCEWRYWMGVAEDLAERGSEYAQRLLEDWFGSPRYAQHVTPRQIVALGNTQDAFDAHDEETIERNTERNRDGGW